MKPFPIDYEDYIPTNVCNAWVATAVIGSAAIGAGAQIYGANKAADAQTQASGQALDFQKLAFSVNNSNLAPYRNLGTDAGKQLADNNYYTTPITMDQATLEKTPGYQFNLTQGLKATQNAAAARGLGVSGAALKGAASFATGLADNTYQNQFNNANTNNTNAYNRLKGLVDTGENAAAQTGVAAQNFANGSSAAVTGAGNAQAAADNKTGQAIGNLASSVGGYAAYKGLYGNGGGNVGGMPATGFGAPDDFTSNAFAVSQGINPF